jgi:hypothetical protein
LKKKLNKKKEEPKADQTVLRRESDRNLVEMIRRQLALPPSKRTHFLRVRLPNGGTAL